MANRIYLRRGIEADIPTLGVGEPAFTTDSGKFFIGSDSGNILVAQVASTGVGPAGPEGPEGIQGEVGAPFQISKLYTSQAELDADTAPSDIDAGQFAMVDTGDVEDGETGRLYLWNGVAYSFIVDMSGAAGIEGPQGSQGIQGAAGASGADGSSAYDVAVIDGFVGDRFAWLVSLVGADGAQGLQGDAGAAGVDGAVGAVGAQGLQGDAGAAGVDGAVGADGAQGLQGDAGAAGVDGAAGADGDATAYLPGTAGDWSGTAPSTIAQALDRIAAALGPIAE